MKKGIFTSVLFALSFLLLNSCNQTAEDSFSLGDIYISMGLIGSSTQTGYDFVIYCDNGDTLLPVVNATNNFETYNNQRVLINYTILDEASQSNHRFYVKINNLHEILYKDIIELTTSNSDSIGTDPLQISNIWIAKNMLNIEFRYKGYNMPHLINLCYTTNANNLLDEPVILELRHNANNDEESLVFDAIVTFKLDLLVQDSNNNSSDSINFMVKSTNYQNEEQTFTGIYGY